jgi:hypothetical protein
LIFEHPDIIYATVKIKFAFQISFFNFFQQLFSIIFKKFPAPLPCSPTPAIRAFDKKNGKVLWEYQLPAGGFATPIAYSVEGKQYIAIAAGGARGAKAGGWYVAFTLK